MSGERPQKGIRAALVELWRWPLLLLGGLAAVALVGVVAFVLLKLAPTALVADHPAARTRAEEISDVRTALLTLLAGLIAVAGAIYTAKTFRLSRQGQITDRLTRAVDQLDSDAVDIRLGGILALERLGHESRQERVQIMEILAGFVRERSPGFERPLPSGPQQAPISGADIQAAMRAIGRRDKREAQTTVHALDLSGVDLRGARLVGGNFSGIIFDDAHLEGADLSGANLVDSVAQRANFDGADLTGATLTDALLARACMRGAELRFAVLDRAKLRDADLRGANLFGAKLGKTDLWKANLSGASLWNADLATADLTDAVLEDAQHNASTVWPQGQPSGSGR